MFSGFFNGLDGCGTLRMMVCINPREADFDESLNVMEFAETTKKIQIERVDPRARFLNTPGRIRGHEVYRDALRRQNEDAPSAAISGLTSNSVYKPIYSLGPDMPKLELDQVSGWQFRGHDIWPGFFGSLLLPRFDELFYGHFLYEKFFVV